MRTTFTHSICLFIVFHDVSLDNLYILYRFVLSVCLDHAQLSHNAHALAHAAKDSVLSIQPRRRRQGDEKLASIRIRAAVCHAQNSSAGMLEGGRNLVLELGAIDRCPAPPGARWVAALNHKVGDDAVEDEAVEVIALGEGGEVLACLGRVVAVELYGDGPLRVLVTETFAYGRELTKVVSSATLVVMMICR